MNTLEATAKNLRNDLDEYKRRFTQITEQHIDKVVPQNKGSKLVYANIFDMLDDSTLVKKAGEIIKKPDTVVIFINTNNSATVLLACNDKLQINCNSILKSVLGKFGGKGGGKPNFANGSVPKDKIHEMFDALLKDLNLE
jgi:alanyl-tRNA synthetase